MDFSEINEDLIVGTTPSAADYDLLRRLGVGLVINMRLEQKPFPDEHDPPLEFLWFPAIDYPLFPIPISFLVRGTKKALQVIQSGKRVYTHCQGGRHRGVAMGAAILIARGHSPEDAMNLLKEKRLVADPDIFYIRSRILRFAKVWQANSRK
ncbi:MAG: dual specificity protein phosphatase family protein [Anaerolineales bacterium]